MKLVIVESPEIAQRLADLLGKEFVVKVCAGPIWNLLPGETGVDAASGYAAQYEVRLNKELALAALKKAVKGAEVIYLATDPGLQGENAAQLIVDALPEPDRHKTLRLDLHEMTEVGIQQALASARVLNPNLVKAARAHEVMDHLTAHALYPLLVKWGLLESTSPSLNLVEGTALRLVVEREEALRVSKPHSTPRAAAQVQNGAVRFWASMSDTQDIRTADDAYQVIETLMLPETGWMVERVERHEETDQPPAPFTTSTLLDQAESALRLTPKQTNEAAKELYLAGLITYPYSRSTVISAQACQAGREMIACLFGTMNLPQLSPAASEQAVDSFEEAIRPTDPTRLPEQLETSEFSQEAVRVYSLIWLRFIGSQLNPARLAVTLLTIRPTWTGSAEPWEEARVYPHPYTFQARLRWPIEDGYLAVIPGHDNPDLLTDEIGDQVVHLPDVEQGDTLIFNQIHAVEAAPPVRFSEAGLIAELSSVGIGSPKEHLKALEALGQKGYVRTERSRLIPTMRGEDVLYLALAHFAGVFDLNLLSGMGDLVDLVAQGKADYESVLKIFYSGRLARALDAAHAAVEEVVDDEPIGTYSLMSKKESA